MYLSFLFDWLFFLMSETVVEVETPKIELPVQNAAASNKEHSVHYSQLSL